MLSLSAADLEHVVNILERVRLVESNYGRDWGWAVHADGRVRAVLTEPEWLDMFWYNYRVEAIEPGAEEVYTNDFWARSDLVYRNQMIDEIEPAAFKGGSAPPSLSSPFVSMRALHSSIRLTRFERCLIAFRRRARQGLGRGRPTS